MAHGHGPHTDTTRDFFLNLSDFPLTEPMKSLLNRGLSFCPSQFDPDYGQIMNGVDKLHRQMRRTVFFHTEKEDEGEDTHPFLSIINHDDQDNTPPPFEHPKFKHPSKFDVKPERQPTLQVFCKTTKQKIYQDVGHTPKFHNLTKAERKAKLELETKTQYNHKTS